MAEAPQRALQFLSTAARSVPIRTALAKRGYTDEEHAEGWSLLLAVTGYRAPVATSLTLAPDVRDAVAELDAWDEPNFRIIRATLERRFPAQAEFVLAGLQPSVGPASVVGISILLDRLDALEKGKERKESRKEDAAALETLAQRGIGAAERARLRALVETASRAEMPEADTELELEAQPDPRATKASAEHQEAARALYQWYREWSEVARAVITRRDYLIRLGLAQRKVKSAPKAATPE